MRFVGATRMLGIGRWTAYFAVAMVVAAVSTGSVGAGEVILKNGLVIDGTPRRLESLTMDNIRQRLDDVPSFPYVMIENGYQRIFVPRGQTAQVVQRDDLSKYETFRLRPHRTGNRRTAGRVVATSPFNASGQRTHTLRTPNGREEDIVVAVTNITPKYVSVTGLNHQWEYGIATQAIPPDQLDAMVQKANDPKNPDHRFSIARFYLQAEMYEESGKELDSIAKDFPELASRVAESRKELDDLEHRLIMQELTRRKAAGQYELAHAYALAVPQANASAAVLHDVHDLLRDYDAARERIAKARVLLSELQAKMDNHTLVAAVMPLRAVIDDQLTIESLDRLQAFFNLADDNTLRPAEKLALAYSGWVVGSAAAVTDLPLAVRMWQAQHDILEYLRADNPQDRRDRVSEIERLDGIGPDTVLKLLRCLPPVMETPDIRTCEPATLQVAGRDSEKVPSYGVLIPPEYDFRHAYPLIVTLHPAEHSPKAMLEWWGGTAAKQGMALKRGYIVIAPEYAEPGDRKYNYSITAHDAVLRAIVDARKRFNIDSDRVFLSGHGMGADAAFDIGMSHPDVFAGVIPINGLCEQSCRWYWDHNAGHTAWYVVTGEFDGRDTFGIDARTLGSMMRQNQDVVFVQFAQRGYEPYFEETPRIFDWLEVHRRSKPPREFDMRVLRASESRFYWLQANDLPQSVLQPTFLAEPRGNVHAMPLRAKITPGNTIFLTSGARSHTLWLSPELASFDQRFTVRLKGQQKFRGFVKASTEAMLDDYRLRADRQLIYTVRLEL